MKITKLNCTACGAPISVPEDLDILFCSSCGSKLAVDRGEGYVTLKLIEKLAQAIQDSGEKTTSAIKDSTYVTKAELIRMQINQSINTEAMKMTTLQQEIRSLQRKPQLTPVEIAQLSELRINELNSLLSIRKQRMELSKLDEGWEESMEVFQTDLNELNKIIGYFAPCAIDYKTQAALNDLVSERTRCENALTSLEKKLLLRKLKFPKYGPVDKLSVEELENLEKDMSEDMELLTSNPQSQVKQGFRNQLQEIRNRFNAIFPRKKVESATGPLKSLDLHPPYSEFPFELIPLIELVKSDQAKVNESPENPSKHIIKAEIEKIGAVLQARHDLDIPGQRIKAEQQKKKERKTNRIIALVILGVTVLTVIVFALIRLGSRSTPVKSTTNSPTSSNRESTVSATNTQNNYTASSIDLFEIVALRTYLRPEADINSKEGAELVHGELMLSLGQAVGASDWYAVQLLRDDSTGFLYQQWVSPVTGKSVKAKTFSENYNSLLYKEDFSRAEAGWYEGDFNDDLGKWEYDIENGVYQIDLTLNESGYVYSTADIVDLAPNYLVTVHTTMLDSDGLSASGMVINYTDENNFDYFVITSEGNVTIGATRNNYSRKIYSTADSPNPVQLTEGDNELSVLVEVDDADSSTQFTYIVNGYEVYELAYTHPQDLRPTVGVIVWSMDPHLPVSYTFDNFVIYTK